MLLLQWRFEGRGGRWGGGHWRSVYEGAILVGRAISASTTASRRRERCPTMVVGLLDASIRLSRTIVRLLRLCVLCDRVGLFLLPAVYCAGECSDFGLYRSVVCHDGKCLSVSQMGMPISFGICRLRMRQFVVVEGTKQLESSFAIC